jgi:predicted transcriptional regulator
MTTTVTLTEQEHIILSQLAQQTGRTEDELLHEAITQYLSHVHLAYRRQLLHEARGMWQDRTDIADIHALRGEFDR